MLRALFQTSDITPPPSEGAQTAVGCKQRENTSRTTPAYNDQGGHVKRVNKGRYGQTNAGNSDWLGICQHLPTSFALLRHQFTTTWRRVEARFEAKEERSSLRGWTEGPSRGKMPEGRI